jgi:hypothetical protein
MTEVSVLSGTDSRQAVKFLDWLDPTGLHNLVAIDPVTKAVEAETFDFCSDKTLALEWVAARNGRKNLYFSINEPKAGARTHSKLRRDEIGALRAFAVDLDEVPQGYPWGDPIDDYVPSAVIDSGNGRWAFWKLAEKQRGDIADIEAQNKALAAKFHGDAVATNLDRIARLPGTLNIPNEAKRKKGRVEATSCILSTSRLTYTAGEIAAWCPPLAGEAFPQPKADQTPLAELDSPASVARAARWLLTDAGEAVEGANGNAATYAVAARLKDFGVSQHTAFELLLDGWNETKATPPWPATELLQIVRNAFAYGSAAPGRNAPNLAEAEFDAVEITESPKPKRSMTAQRIGDINQNLKAEARHLIEGYYDQGATIVTYGESNSGKTHVVLDQSLAIATGRPWAGRAVHKGLVVYVAAEGGHGVEQRIMAHKKFRKDVDWANTPFALVKHPINLMSSPADAKALIAIVREQEAAYGQKCVMVVIDTLSRALAGGDENSSADMGALVKRCDEIRFATGAALHIIHHAGKNTAKGARGHSLLRAAVDTEIEIENRAILSRKQRDMEPSPDLRFDYKQVVLGENLAGVAVTSVVLEAWAASEFDPGLTPATQKVLEAAEAVVMQKMQNVGAANIASDTGLFSPKEIIALGESKSTVERSIAELLGEGSFVKCKRGLYKLRNSPKASSFTQPQSG